MWKLSAVSAVSAVLVLALCLLAATATAAAPPVRLPGERSERAANASRAGAWLLGVRKTASTAALLHAAGARPVGRLPGVFRVSASRARSLGRKLGAAGALTFAEPDVLQRPVGAIAGLDEGTGQWPLMLLRGDAPPPPAVGPASPLIAVIDGQVDLAHREFVGAPLTALGGQDDPDAHATAVVSIVSGPRDGVGTEGLWPGARTLAIGTDLSCSETAAAVDEAVRRGARVINMSYEGPGCFAHRLATQRAVRRGVLLVASAGNLSSAGDTTVEEPVYPASDPHVLTVGAVGPDLRPAAFSRSLEAIDLAAPGVSVAGAVPGPDQELGATTWTLVSGTSYAAPFVSAAAGWVAAERPELSADQLAEVLRASATRRRVGRSGFHPQAGHGVLDVGAALSTPAPMTDPLEPDDDLGWVNGALSGRPAPNLAGPRSAALRRAEDEVDVHRVKVRAGACVAVRVRGSGAVRVRVVESEAETVDAPGALVDRASPDGDVTVRVPRARTTRSVYMAVMADGERRDRIVYRVSRTSTACRGRSAS